MVENRITDGRRIAQLFASELDGRSDGRLESVAVTNADADVEPTEAGARAYDIAVEGSTAATAFIHPDRVRVEMAVEEERVGTVEADGVERDHRADGTAISIEYGAAVKRAVDVLVAAVATSDR